MRRTQPLALPLLLAAALSSTCSPEQAPVLPEGPFNVIFILVDTLRADHLGAYGYPRPTSPVFDALAEEGVLFEQNMAQASCTFPSVNSLLSSRHPSVFFLSPDRYQGIPEDIPTLPKILKNTGFSTAAVSASTIVTAEPQGRYHGGFGGGFETFDQSCTWQSAGCVRERGVKLARELEEPFFLYLHFMEPHDPYSPPKSHDPSFVKAYEGHPFVAEGDPRPIERMLYSDGPPVEIGDRDIEHLIDLYDEEIRFFDAQLDLLIEALRATGTLDRTVLVLASDHGEEFLEHGHVKHCRTVYQSSLHTPLLLWFPAAFPDSLRARRISQPVANLDVVPTLLDYLGIDQLGLELDGKSLRSLIEAQAAPPGTNLLYGAQGSSRAIREGDLKLIVDLKNDTEALFDLAADPGELDPIQDRRPDDSRRLRSELLLRVHDQEGGVKRGFAAARAAEEELKALGYLE